jgi:hypothetical protein
MNKKLGWMVILVALMWTLILPQTTRADGLDGRWRGGWESCDSGHKGKLSAKFRRIDSTHVRAKFTGTFAKVIPFRYRPILEIVYEEPGLMVLQGNKRLPLGGTFQYNATVSGGQFSATYRSKRDSGVWQMRR